MTNPTEAPMACTGCGSLRTDKQCRDEQKSCCPDRHMVPVAELITDLWAKVYSPAPSQHTGWSDEAVEALREIAEMTDPDSPDSYRADDREGCLDTVNATARAAVTAASSIAPATGFEVKDLAWQLTGPPGSDIEASTAIGVYTINRDDLSAGGGYNLWMAGETNDDIFTSFHSLLEAKAAAQVHFDAAVRSSISPSVAKESGEP